MEAHTHDAPHGDCAHGHDHSHDHSHEATPKSTLGFALALTACFMVVEVVGGWWTGSLALLADAGHMASDVGALALALMAVRVAARPADQRQTMGYQRAEVLGAAVNAGALAVLAVWIAVEAFSRAAHPSPVLGGPMMAVATIGFLVNVIVAFKLHGGHEHDLNTQAAWLHVMGDLLGSLGAMLAGALIMLFDWTWADPLISVVIAGILVVGSVRVLKRVSSVLMQGAPDSVDVDQLRAAILAVDGVCELHDLHVWTLKPGNDVVTVHAVLYPDVVVETTCSEVSDTILARVPTAHVTVQPETALRPCR